MKNKKRINIFAIIILIIWTLMIVISAISTINNISKKQNYLAVEHAKNAFEKDMMFRKWVAMHGGVYVFPTEKTPPNPYLKHIKNRDIHTTSGDMLTLMNPAYILRELMQNFTGMYGEKGHITSLKLLNPENKPDEWETKVLKKFHEKELLDYYEFYNYQGSEHLRYMKALVLRPDCLKCHAQQGYKVGDIRGGVSITIPMLKYYNDGDIEIKNSIYLHLIIWIVSFIIGLLAYKIISKVVEKEISVSQELEQQEKILQEQAKMVSMGEMIGNIAHQWRQPLSVISTGATGMKVQKEYGVLTDELFHETCDAINNNAQYLSKTIDDFRDFIKGDKKKQEFSLNEQIKSFLHLVEGTIKNNYITIQVDIGDKITIVGYENELTQCMINIFNNAKDALKELKIDKKLIFITVIQKDEYVIIKIKDNAGGVPEDIIQKIFEPYFTTKDKSKGTGLGLYMTYKLVVEGMNGTVDVHNKEYNYEGQNYHGAEFEIRLPIK